MKTMAKESTKTSVCCNAVIIWQTNEVWPYEAVRVCIKCGKTVDTHSPTEPTKENKQEKIKEMLKRYIAVPAGNNESIYRNQFVGDMRPLIDDILALLTAQKEKMVEIIRERIGQCKQPVGNSCEYCSALHDVISMISPLSEHDLELIKEGRAMSDFDIRRGE